MIPEDLARPASSPYIRPLTLVVARRRCRRRHAVQTMGAAGTVSRGRERRGSGPPEPFFAVWWRGGGARPAPQVLVPRKMRPPAIAEPRFTSGGFAACSSVVFQAPRRWRRPARWGRRAVGELLPARFDRPGLKLVWAARSCDARRIEWAAWPESPRPGAPKPVSPWGCGCRRAVVGRQRLGERGGRTSAAPIKVSVNGPGGPFCAGLPARKPFRRHDILWKTKTSGGGPSPSFRVGRGLDGSEGEGQRAGRARRNIKSHQRTASKKSETVLKEVRGPTITSLSRSETWKTKNHQRRRAFFTDNHRPAPSSPGGIRHMGKPRLEG